MMKANEIIVRITPELIAEVSGKDEDQFNELRALDLHLRGSRKGKIKRIESLVLVPNLIQLNLSYNLISKIEGLDRVGNLVELNLAENSISKIEGVDHLKCLERLNLSGNQIERIPESISNLISLIHLRLARNKISILPDVRYLASLQQLKHLRLDENPIMREDYSDLYTIYYIRSLFSLNGQDIDNRDRIEARRMFASDELADLRSRLSMEQHNLARLKKDLQQSPDKVAILRIDVSKGLGEDVEEIDQMNRNLAEKLQIIQQTEEKIMTLRRRIQDLEESSAQLPPTPAALTSPRAEASVNKSPGDFHNSRLQSNTATPQVESGDVSNIREIASRQVSDLSSRMERMTARMLTAEKEKKDLEAQINSQKVLVDNAMLLDSEFRDYEEKLGMALRAAQSANQQLKQRERELHSCRQELQDKEKILDNSENRVIALELEIAELGKELDFFRSLQQDRGERGVIGGGERQAQAERLESLTYKMAIEDLEKRNKQLNYELEEGIKHSAALSEQVIAAQRESESWKEKAWQCQTEHRQHIRELEEDNIRYRNMVNDLRSDLQTIQSERDKCQSSWRKAESDLNAFMKAKTQAAKNTRYPNSVKKAFNYLEVASTDSEDGQERSDRSDDNIVFPKSPLREQGMSHLEQKSVEIMSHILLEEMKLSKLKNTHIKTDGLKEVCIRAMLRIFNHSKAKIDDQSAAEEETGQVVSPFHILGDRKFLSRLVSDICENMCSLEDSENIKSEIKQLEIVASELERKVSKLDENISMKESILNTLERQGQEAKRHAEGTLLELEQMSQRLQNHRNELLQLTAQQQLTKREVDINKTTLQEISSVSTMEQNNLQKLRERAVEAKQELSKLEQLITQQKDMSRKEEHKYKNMKFIQQEEIQGLQQEIKSVQADIQMKKTSIDELESVRKRLDDELDSRQREFYYAKQQISQHHNEELQRLNQTKNELKSAQLANDQAASKLRQLESELEKMQERVSTEMALFELNKTDILKKQDSYETSVRQLEKQLKVLKENKIALENDHMLLSHSVEELRRQQYDVERLKEQRSKQAESDLSAVQSQIVINQRLLKQISVQVDQKQHELQLLEQEHELLKGKVQEGKKMLQSQETTTFQNKELLKKLEYNAESLQKGIVQLKKEHDNILTESNFMRIQMTADTAQYDELKRKITALKMEEETIHSHEGQIRISLQHLKQQVQELREEYDSIISSKDRETFALKDLSARKMHMENEIQKLETILNSHKERVAQDYIRKDDVDQKVLQSIEEMHRLQKELLQIQQKIGSYEEKERNFSMQEQTHRAKLQKITFETDAMKEHYQKEKMLMDRLREEYRELQLHNNRLKEELAYLEQEVQSKQTTVEQSKLQHGHLQQQRDSLLSELNTIKENAKRELKRIDALEETYNTVDKRLMKLREELGKAEESTVQIKNVSKDEQQKVSHYQDLISASISELKRLESAIENARGKLNEERQRAIQEIGMLDQAKSTARSELLRLDETKRKLSQASPLPSVAYASQAPSQNFLSMEKSSLEIIGRNPGKAEKFPSSEILDFKTLNNSNGNITDDSSLAEGAPINSLQKAVENLRMQSASAVSQVKMKL